MNLSASERYEIWNMLASEMKKYAEMLIVNADNIPRDADDQRAIYRDAKSVIDFADLSLFAKYLYG
jgi:hypothetical protein